MHAKKPVSQLKPESPYNHLVDALRTYICFSVSQKCEVGLKRGIEDEHVHGGIQP